MEVQRQLTAIGKAAADAMRMFFRSDLDRMASKPTWKHLSLAANAVIGSGVSADGLRLLSCDVMSSIDPQRAQEGFKLISIGNFSDELDWGRKDVLPRERHFPRSFQQGLPLSSCHSIGYPQADSACSARASSLHCVARVSGVAHQ